jgi:hypothetical protein
MSSTIFKAGCRVLLAGSVLGVLSAGGNAFGDKLFDDTFTTSTANPSSYPTPSSSSTGYDVASTKAATNSTITGGKLHMTLNAATTSGVVEAQARFASSPVSLGVGDTMHVTMTFTDTSNVIAAGTSSFLYLGLYNSGNVNPVNGLNNSGLSTGSTTAATGGANLWQGYATRIAGSGGLSQIYTRPAQTGSTNATNAHQDLVGNGAGGGLYNDPAGTQIGSSLTSSATLTATNVYTDDFAVTLNADGTLTFASNLYTGADTNGTNISSMTGTTDSTSAAPLVGSPITSFDSLALGYRTSGTSLNPVMDVTEIVVSTVPGAAPIPEPASLAVLGVGGLLLVARRRKA